MVTSGEKGGGKGTVGEGIIIIYKINKLQGYLVQYKEHSQYFIITINRI